MSHTQYAMKTGAHYARAAQLWLIARARRDNKTLSNNFVTTLTKKEVMVRLSSYVKHKFVCITAIFFLNSKNDFKESLLDAQNSLPFIHSLHMNNVWAAGCFRCEIECGK